MPASTEFLEPELQLRLLKSQIVLDVQHVHLHK
jgi:hypothetical protein